jgi:RimJ/RimL family protein N-acetyltransferase
MVPIRSLGPRHRDRIAQHLLALDADDRYLRFGYAATDEQIRRYVQSLDFDRDEIFGIVNRRLELVAMAHLAMPKEEALHGIAEFAVSVARQARGRGLGSRLFERACIHARNEGIDQLMIHALSENKAMLRIARKAGATLERSGSETEAFLRLPPATFETRMSALVGEQFALTDYGLKAQAKTLRELIAAVNHVREGVRDARHRSTA